jgi:U3 small nucleolar RNA-associated protein 14
VQAIENYQYEMPDEFVDEDIDEDMAFTAEDEAAGLGLKLLGRKVKKVQDSDGDDDDGVGGSDEDQAEDTVAEDALDSFLEGSGGSDEEDVEDEEVEEEGSGEGLQRHRQAVLRAGSEYFTSTVLEYWFPVQCSVPKYVVSW